MSKKIKQKIFLDNLPMKYGIGSNKNTLVIDWEKSIGYKVRFIYDDIDNFIEIISYNKKKSKITIKYENEEFDIASGNLKKCKIGVILDKHCRDFKYNIGDIISDDRGSGLILKQIRIGKDNNRGYLIECLECHNKYKRTESHIITRDGFKCSICSDGNKYPSKFVYNMLKQLNIEFETEYSPKWCKYLFKNKLKQGRYDFYFKLNDEEYILETDGKQHIEEQSKNSKWDKTLSEQIYIDDEKDKLAKEHGIEVIRIDCKLSEVRYIKNSIVNNYKINKLFDLSRIDWIKCEEFALSNRIKEACNLWNSGINNTKEIAKSMNMHFGTINRYLKLGYSLNWCDYMVSDDLMQYNIEKVSKIWENGISNVKEICNITKLFEKTVIKYLKEGTKQGICTYNPYHEIYKAISTNWKNNMKEFICIENGKIFNNAKDCINYFNKHHNIKLIQSSISSVCLNKISHHKGYHFKYISDLTEEQINEIQENLKSNKVI